MHQALPTRAAAKEKTNFVNLFTGLWVIQQCYERWCKDAGRKIGWDTVVAQADNATGGKAFIDLDAPEFAQPNTNMPLEIQKYCKKHGQDVPDGIGEISRCILRAWFLSSGGASMTSSDLPGWIRRRSILLVVEARINSSANGLRTRSVSLC